MLDHPFCFLRLIIRKMAHHRNPGRKLRYKRLFHPELILFDETVRNRQNLRRRTVIFHHHDGLCPCKMLVKIKKVPDIGTAPGVDRLIRISDDKKITMIAFKHLH